MHVLRQDKRLICNKNSLCQAPDYLKDAYSGSPMHVDVAFKTSLMLAVFNFELFSPSIGSYYFVTR
jgi:hypothetical protein